MRFCSNLHVEHKSACRSGDRADRQGEGRLAGAEQSGQGGVPGQDCSDDAEPATERYECARSRQVSDSQAEEGQGKDREHCDKGDITSQCTDEHDCGEYRPAQEKETQSLRENSSFDELSRDAAAWEEGKAYGKPECAIGREGCSTEGIAGLELPHACAELSDTAIEECEANDNAGRARKPARVNATEDKGCKGEGAQAKGTGVCDNRCRCCCAAFGFCCILGHE